MEVAYHLKFFLKIVKILSTLARQMLYHIISRDELYTQKVVYIYIYIKNYYILKSAVFGVRMAISVNINSITNITVYLDSPSRITYKDVYFEINVG